MTEKPMIIQELEQIQDTALEALKKIENEEALQNWRRDILGRTSAVMSVFSNISQHPKELRPLIGQVANQVKQTLETALLDRSEIVKEAAISQKF